MKLLRSRLFLAFLIAAAGLAAFTAMQSARRAEARQILEAEAENEPHYHFVWEREITFAHQILAPVLERIPSTLPKPKETLSEVSIWNQINDPEGLAWPIRQVGLSNYLELLDVPPEQAVRFLRALKKQPKVWDCKLRNIQAGAELSELLANFPEVKYLEISNSCYTFEHFPHLPKLTLLEIASSPLNDAGLRKILQSPQLKDLTIREVSSLSPEALQSIPSWAGPALRNLRLTEMGLSESERDRLQADLVRGCPNVEVWTD